MVRTYWHKALVGVVALVCAAASVACKDEGGKKTAKAAKTNGGAEAGKEKKTAGRRSLPNTFKALLDDPGQPGPGAFDKNFRANDDFFTNMEVMTLGHSPHGAVRIWYSSNVQNIINRATFTAPEGTVAIKKFQNSATSGYAVMVKKSPGYDPEHNDWYFEVRDDEGELLDDPAPGKIAACGSCHAAAAGKDFLAGTELGTPPDTTVDPDPTPDASPSPSPTTSPTPDPSGDPDPDATDGDADTSGSASGSGPSQFQADFATSDAFFQATPDFVQGHSAEHGKLKIWYSSNIKDVISGASFTVPEGTTAVAEFDNDGRPGADGVLVMIKKASGYDPQNNDWYYEVRDQWGGLQSDPAPGRMDSCISCHSAAQATDYLAGTKLNQDAPGAFRPDYASSPSFFTQMTDLMPGKPRVHGDFKIWYSANMRDVISEGKFTAPNGSVAIARTKKGNKLGVVVMVKEDGFDPAHGNWRFETRNRYGTLETESVAGKPSPCRSCHNANRPTDFLRGTKITN